MSEGGQGISVCLLAAGLVLAGLAPLARAVEPGQPVLVIAAPWNGGAEAVVRRAGAALSGPHAATAVAAIAHGAGVEALRAAGAIFVLGYADGWLCRAEGAA